LGKGKEKQKRGNGKGQGRRKGIGKGEGKAGSRVKGRKGGDGLEEGGELILHEAERIEMYKPTRCKIDLSNRSIYQKHINTPATHGIVAYYITQWLYV